MHLFYLTPARRVIKILFIALLGTGDERAREMREAQACRNDNFSSPTIINFGLKRDSARQMLNQAIVYHRAALLQLNTRLMRCTPA
jgi:hypothetical protein